MLEVELKTMLACSTVEHVGLIAVGLGIALRAKAMGDPVLAALALQAALLCAVAHGLFKPLLFLGAGAVKHATGTTSLDWLGGLMRGMPRLGVLMLLGAAGMAALPLGPGFAPEFLLLHAVIAAAATGGILARIGFTALLARLGLSAALALGAAVRLIGIGFLGRPRTLQAAAAEDARRARCVGMALLAILCVPVALLPGTVLAAIDAGHRAAGARAAPAPLAYAPLSLLAAAAGGGGRVLSPCAASACAARARCAAWNGGFGRPPAWLPFGDPVTQPSATGFAEPVAAPSARGFWGRPAPTPPRRSCLAPARATAPARHARWPNTFAAPRCASAWPSCSPRLVMFLLALGLRQGG